ncbi:MAG TPA: copper chaperone PCu(A)C [Pseudorhizobium sp.]|jgi:copper(I)-binding protein|nr:copper chaperone PCu(A)C [Pseudorhizobium sp.]
MNEARAVGSVPFNCKRWRKIGLGGVSFKSWPAKAPPVAPVLDDYLTIISAGTESDRLIGGSTPVAERLEIHESSIVDGIARMRPASDGIEIAPGATVELQPGGATSCF